MAPHPKLVGLVLAAGSGILYGSINVASKFIAADPITKSATAYLVSGLLLSPFVWSLKIERKDWPRVLAMGLVGGGLAPVLLFFGLEHTASADAGLLLTMELVATAVLAFLFLHERVSGRAGTGLGFLFLAALLISFGSGENEGSTDRLGVLLVLGSAVAWGVDNAVSAHLVGNYRPHQLIGLKGLIGGLGAAAAFAATGSTLPDAKATGQLVLVGVLSIALSSMLFYNALRLVGAARTSAMNIGTTAIAGAVGGYLFVSEELGILHAVALGCVFLGAFLLAERPSAMPPMGPQAVGDTARQ